MLLKSNVKDLKKFLKSNNVLLSDEELYCYAEDATNLKLSDSLPELVVFVETIEDVQKIVKYANEHDIPIIARGAGTNMVGACVCPKGGIVINFSKMNKILDFNPEDMTMTVQPGAVVGDIKALAESENLFYPPDPSNFKVSTIGGSIAQSSGGAMSFKYGTTKDYILSLTVVMADGSLLRLGAGTIKDAAGYHLNQLIVGSEGTLAIVVEAQLKLIPKPEASVLMMAYFNSIKDASIGVNNIIKNRVFPATIEFMDNNSISSVEKFYPCGLRTNFSCLLLIEVDGYQSSIDYQCDLVKNALLSSNAVNIEIFNNEEAQEKIWTARRASYAATTKLAPDVLTDDIIVPRSMLANLVEGCREICDKYNLEVCIVGHAGDGNIHPQIALDTNDEHQFENYMKAKAEIYLLTKSLGGTISAEHGIGIEKLNFLQSSENPEVLECMKKIKAAFDPKNILNPGKIFEI